MALVRITPRIGPAQGAQSRPVATPIMIEAQRAGQCAAVGVDAIAQRHEWTRQPVADRAEISDRANSTITISATWRPVLLAWITHSLLTTARLEIRANVRAMPPRVSRIEDARTVGPGEQEGNDRQDARAEDGQYAAQESDE